MGDLIAAVQSHHCYTGWATGQQSLRQDLQRLVQLLPAIVCAVEGRAGNSHSTYDGSCNAPNPISRCAGRDELHIWAQLALGTVRHASFRVIWAVERLDVASKQPLSQEPMTKLFDTLAGSFLLLNRRWHLSAPQQSPQPGPGAVAVAAAAATQLLPALVPAAVSTLQAALQRVTQHKLGAKSSFMPMEVQAGFASDLKTMAVRAVHAA